MARRFDCAFRFVEADLFRLDEPQRSAAFAALTSGDSLPFVILGDEVVCTGGLDVDAIAQGIERHIAGE